jgi:ribonucleoside-triphosphate reductase
MSIASFTDPDAGSLLRKQSVKMQKLDAEDSLPWLWDSSTAKNRPILGRVKSVKAIGERPTYDIEVANNHWYYAGAVKSHNTLSKVMDCTEGAHKPLGKYIFNWITFSNYDPLIPKFRKAGYRIIDKPHSPDSKLVCLPVAHEDVPFDVVERKVKLPRSLKRSVKRLLGFKEPTHSVEELYVNLESAVSQLERYKRLMKHYVDHNCSITISYDSDEVPAIIDWLYDNWDSYVGVSFIYRNDPTKTAADLGYKYLPQEVVTKRVYEEYVATLGEIDIDDANSLLELEDDECATGVCPVR